MDRDASLDEFLDSGGSETNPSEQDTEETTDQDNGSESTVDSGSADEAPDTEATGDQSEAIRRGGDPPEPIDPARSTGRWDPEGAVCDACGAAVTRRWREDEEFRCVECKSW